MSSTSSRIGRLTRTSTRQPPRTTSSTECSNAFLARSFSLGATPSSKSRVTQSAPRRCALSTKRCCVTGTIRFERWSSGRGVAVPGGCIIDQDFGSRVSESQDRELVQLACLKVRQGGQGWFKQLGQKVRKARVHPSRGVRAPIPPVALAIPYRGVARCPIRRRHPKILPSNGHGHT